MGDIMYIYKYPGVTIKTKLPLGGAVMRPLSLSSIPIQSMFSIMSQQSVGIQITTGKQVTFADNTTLDIYGYPLPNYLPDIFDDYANQHGFPATITQQTSSFNLSTLPINHEVVACAFASTNDIYGPKNFELTMEIRRQRDNFKLIDATFFIYIEDGYYYPSMWNICFFFFGYLSSSSVEDWLEIDEISENGTYNISVSFVGDVTGNGSKIITISGIPVTCWYVRHTINGDILHVTIDGFGGYGVDYINIYNSTLGTFQITSRDPPNSYTWNRLYSTWTVQGCTLWSRYINISSLSVGQHQFAFRAYDINGDMSSQSYLIIEISQNRPTNWVWTSNELGAFNNNGAITTLTYQRWNTFLDRIEEFVNYYNNKHGTSVPSVLSYKMTSGNKVLTATRFNGVKFSIGSMNATGITDRVSGQEVMGWYFTRLSDSLNEID